MMTPVGIGSRTVAVEATEAKLARVGPQKEEGHDASVREDVVMIGASWRASGHVTAWLASIATVQEGPYEWGWRMHPMWATWGIVMMLMMLVFWGVVIAGIIVGIRWLLGQGREPRSDRALDILRERYARGDISKEEFDAKKRDLT